MLKGIDMSKWQGKIDWSKVKGNVDFVIIRAGYGKLSSQKDERFEEYYAACEKYGIPKGVYWDSYAFTGSDAIQEANAFLTCVKGKKFEYPVWYDYEAFKGYEKQRNPDVARAVITNFISTVQKAGYYVGLYSYYSMFKDCIPKDLQNKYDIWLAHYTSTTSYKGHKIWQYSETGKIPGITGTVDMDYCYVDNYPEIIRLKGLNNLNASTPTTPVTEDTNKTYPIDSSTMDYNQVHYKYNDNTQISKHFNVQEFKCKCGKQHDIVINTRLVAGLEKLFEIFDCSMIIVNSGYRDPDYDKKMNGFAGKHSVGDAADVVLYDKNKAVISTKKIACAAQDLPEYFGGIANINKTYTAIHLDVRQGNRWLGDETVSNSTVTKDFYSYYNLTKEDVYGKTANTPPSSLDDLNPPTPPMPTEEVLPTPPMPTTEPSNGEEVLPNPPMPDQEPELKPSPKQGDEIKLNSTPLYSSATITRYSSKKTGTFYVYDGNVISGRIRVTNKKENVGKKPMNKYVTGFVNLSDI